MKNLNINKKLILPVVISITTYLLSYGIPKIIVNSENLHYLHIALDDLIPLFSPSIIIYFLAYVQWFFAICVLLKQETILGYRISTAIIIGSLIGFAAFVIYPTAIIRPTIKVNNIFDQILSTTYLVDSVVNACPSFHCFCSTITIHILYRSKDINKKISILNFIFSVLVYASTLLTKQHYIIDIPFGILLADISVLISSKIYFKQTI